MEYRQLGRTDLQVSLICLGTMTWGQQNSEEEAHQQMDRAWERGINFMDAAEMYPVPPMAETQGRTEAYIGTWLSARKNRDQVILATKIAGPSRGMSWIRGGQTRFNKAHIQEALEGSLKRLQTDYIDLYQLHWPERSVNMFGQLGYVHQSQDRYTPLLETLEILESHVQAGRIRYIGLSNETPWGTMTFLQLADTLNKPRMVSIQNPYNLLNRSFEVGLAEVAIREQCGLLAYSPLAMGMLTGKYAGGQQPPNARMTLFPHFSRYSHPAAVEASEGYVQIARAAGLSPTQMALAFVNQQPFVTSNIIGATTLEQLDENIDSLQVTLSPDVIAQIDALHAVRSNPAP